MRRVSRPGCSSPDSWDPRSRLPLLDGSNLVGAILPSNRLGRLESVDRQTFEFEGARGEMITRRGKDVVVAEMYHAHHRLRGATRPVGRFRRPGPFTLAFERSAGADAVLGRDGLRLGQVGPGRYTLVLEGGAGRPTRPHLACT